MKHIPMKPLAPLMIAATLLVAHPVHAEQAEVDGEAMIRKMGATLKEIESSRVKLTQALFMKSEGMKQEMTTESRVSINKPSQFAMEITSGVMGATLIADGEKVYFYWPMMRRYTELAMPESLEAIFELPEYAMGGMNLGQLNIARALVADDPAETILRESSRVDYAGIEDLDGVEAHHLIVVQGAAPVVIEHHLWLYTGDRPLPVKLETDMSKTMGALQGMSMPGMKDMEMRTETYFKGWEVGVDTREGEFVFTVPEGAELMDSPFSAGQDKGGDANALVDTDAPDFTLETLAGEDVSLSSHEGKDVVVLDFWATWCGPCVRAMPELQKVAEAYKDKGVVVYAVNQQEGKLKVEKFIERRKLDVNVLLDPKGLSGTAYRAEAIPQTVIVDKEGVIRSVHVGYSPRLKAILSAELDKLLEGQELPES